MQYIFAGLGYKIDTGYAYKSKKPINIMGPTPGTAFALLCQLT